MAGLFGGGDSSMARSDAGPGERGYPTNKKYLQFNAVASGDMPYAISDERKSEILAMYDDKGNLKTKPNGAETIAAPPRKQTVYR